MFAEARHHMIQQQIRPWEVLDNRVLNVFEAIHRDEFLDDSLKPLAYADTPLPVAAGELMLPPTLEGRMLQSLEIKPADSILEIGSGVGYITACLCSLGEQVHSVDLHGAVTEIAEQNLSRYGLKNFSLQTITSLNLITDNQRYDVIAINGGSLELIPQNLLQALSIGGRLFAVTGQPPVMHATLCTRDDSKHWSYQSLFETNIPRLA